MKLASKFEMKTFCVTVEISDLGTFTLQIKSTNEHSVKFSALNDFSELLGVDASEITVVDVKECEFMSFDHFIDVCAEELSKLPELEMTEKNAKMIMQKMMYSNTNPEITLAVRKHNQAELYASKKVVKVAKAKQTPKVEPNEFEAYASIDNYIMETSFL